MSTKVISSFLFMLIFISCVNERDDLSYLSEDTLEKIRMELKTKGDKTIAREFSIIQMGLRGARIQAIRNKYEKENPSKKRVYSGESGKFSREMIKDLDSKITGKTQSYLHHKLGYSSTAIMIDDTCYVEVIGMHTIPYGVIPTVKGENGFVISDLQKQRVETDKAEPEGTLNEAYFYKFKYSSPANGRLVVELRYPKSNELHLRDEYVPGYTPYFLPITANKK